MLKITNKNRNIMLNNLNELLEIEVHELEKYSETPICSKAKQGMEDEYNYYKHKVQLILEIKHIIFFPFGMS